VNKLLNACQVPKKIGADDKFAKCTKISRAGALLLPEKSIHDKNGGSIAPTLQKRLTLL